MTLTDQKINDLRDQLLNAHQQGIKIVITLGPIKTGKSTLINRMVGHEMVAERRTSMGKRSTMRGTVGIYRDETVNQNLPSLEVTGRVSTETPYPVIITHNNICYLDLPEIHIPSKHDVNTPVIDPVCTLARLANSCETPLPIHALFLVFTELNFSDSSMNELDDIVTQLSVLFKNIPYLQAVHLVMNNKNPVEKIADNCESNNVKIELQKTTTSRYSEILSDIIEKAQDKFQEDINILQRNRNGWHALLNGLVRLFQPQNSENEAELKSSIQANQFLARLTHTVRLKFYSTDDVVFINDLLSKRGLFSTLQKRLEPLLIRDLKNKRWILRALDENNRSYDETTIAQSFKDFLKTLGFNKELSSQDESDLHYELNSVLYDELPNCKMILFNPLDNGESRQALLDAVNNEHTFDLSELNVTLPSLQKHQEADEAQSDTKKSRPISISTPQPIITHHAAVSTTPTSPLSALSQPDNKASGIIDSQNTSDAVSTLQKLKATADTELASPVETITLPSKPINKPRKTKTSNEVSSGQKNILSHQTSNAVRKPEPSCFGQVTGWLQQHTTITTFALLLTAGLLVTSAIVLCTPFSPVWLASLSVTQPTVFYSLVVISTLLLTGLAALFIFSLAHRPVEMNEAQYCSTQFKLSRLNTYSNDKVVSVNDLDSTINAYYTTQNSNVHTNLHPLPMLARRSHHTSTLSTDNIMITTPSKIPSLPR